MQHSSTKASTSVRFPLSLYHYTPPPSLFFSTSSPPLPPAMVNFLLKASSQFLLPLSISYFPSMFFSIFHISEIILYVPLLLPSLSMIYISHRNLHDFIFSYGWVVFCCVYMCHSFFIQSYILGHLNKFQILAIDNSAALNTGVQMSFLNRISVPLE